MPDIDKDVQKEAVKEALREWLDSQFATFGKWTLSGLVASAFAGMIYLWLASHGWVPTK
ncbi:hypothetical protein RGU70_13590 [Herbaspirillum sp. RTI4]|uniref:hypothetical protein n=1 Tax=Herbaspirillum sp. RTI4 TaxID=3048640 RepID=UPI002AB3FA5E|nr:hypothetical protein [Herbaspirillum sp. RTI4]MDY7579346.1 hypothetical protein [Herbaspirillum sp. RTI4]MEA9980260.1 hypothetical protein [Herbaspirillum sp. RTI4]